MVKIYKSIEDAIIDAYDPQKPHWIICRSEKNKSAYFIYEKDNVLPGCTKLTLSEINSLVEKHISDKEFTGSMQFADAMEKMGNQKMKKSFTCCPGDLKWFFTCLANWLSGNGFQTSADHAKSLSKQIIDITSGKNPYDYRARIFQETKHRYETEGYSKGEKVIQIDNKQMLAETVPFGSDKIGGMAPLPPITNPFKTKFQVTEDDTFNVMLKYAEANENPVGINMANQHIPGGGVISGCPAQEEALCRRSNHYFAIEKQKYPLPDFGGIYSPHVTVFRHDEKSSYAFMDKPKQVSLVAIAAYNNPVIDDNYRQGTKEKIRNMLRIMAQKGHTTAILGALGCGAFRNPPTVVAQLFKEVFEENEFQDRFKTVDFAILCQNEKDKDNVAAFKAICEQLN